MDVWVKFKNISFLFINFILYNLNFEFMNLGNFFYFVYKFDLNGLYLLF